MKATQKICPYRRRGQFSDANCLGDRCIVYSKSREVEYCAYTGIQIYIGDVQKERGKA